LYNYIITAEFINWLFI